MGQSREPFRGGVLCGREEAAVVGDRVFVEYDRRERMAAARADRDGVPGRLSRAVGRSRRGDRGGAGVVGGREAVQGVYRPVRRDHGAGLSRGPVRRSRACAAAGERGDHLHDGRGVYGRAAHCVGEGVFVVPGDELRGRRAARGGGDSAVHEHRRLQGGRVQRRCAGGADVPLPAAAADLRDLAGGGMGRVDGGDRRD